MSAIEEIAERLQARRVRPGRWIAKCPAHADRAPSLTIADGRDGRVLLHCFAGCPLDAILLHAGISMRHLFAASPHAVSNPRQRAAEARDRDRQRAEEAARRRTERTRTDRLRADWHELNQSAATLARKLASIPDGTPGAEAFTECFHEVLAELRSVDRMLMGGDEWL
jgi:hypothetical protein